jgi:hypothetical protein
MPNVVGAIPSTAIGLSNMCHSDRELGRFSSFSNASGSLIWSSIADTQNMSLIGSSGSLGCSFMELMNHSINESQDYYLKAMTQRQVEGMFYEPEDTSSGDQSESNTIFQLEGNLPTGFNFMASSWSRENGGDSNGGVGITLNHLSRLPFCQTFTKEDLINNSPQIVMT